MKPGAGTPEELETLFEDAFLLRDSSALAELFDDGALLAAAAGDVEARGGEEIAHLAAAMWERDYAFVAAPRRLLQSHELALVLAEQSINVVRRGRDGRWRYAISLVADAENDTRRQP
jgi:hypothetical protein